MHSTNSGFNFYKMQIYVPVFVIAIFLLMGCVSETNALPSEKQVSFSSENFDLNEDGAADFSIYTFSPVSFEGVTVQKQFVVFSEPFGIVQPKAVITGVDAVRAKEFILSFERKQKEVENRCSRELGLAAFTCPDPKTCAVLCSQNSAKCKRLAETYKDAIGYSIFSYAKDSSLIRTTLSELLSAPLEEITETERSDFLKKLELVRYHAKSMAANPIFWQKDIQLCDGKISTTELDLALDKLGNASAAAKNYRYRMLLRVDFSEAGRNENLKKAEYFVTDPISTELAASERDIAIPENVKLNSTLSAYYLNWKSFQPAKTGKIILSYEFLSEKAPGPVANKLVMPSIYIKTFSFEAIKPIIFIYEVLFSIINNFYISLALSIGISAAILLISYNLIILVFHIQSAFANHQKISYGIRKAFGKTRIEWKNDLILAVILLVAGMITAFQFAPEVGKISFLSVLDLLSQGERGVETGIALLSLSAGFILFYMVLENITKIMALERLYGKVLKEEHETLLASADELKKKLKEFQNLIDNMTAEGFEVGQEYLAIVSYQIEKPENMKHDPHLKRNIEAHLERIEEARNVLMQRKKTADENWPLWDNAIGKLLAEREEVHMAHLISIPATMRKWAAQRYLAEHEEEGAVQDGETIKREVIAPEKLANNMLIKNLVRGIVLINQDKIVFSKISNGSGTVMAALTLKLLNYLNDSAKTLDKHGFTSFASIGSTYVIIAMKHKIMQSILIVEKEKFKETIEKWKEKTKNI